MKNSKLMTRLSVIGATTLSALSAMSAHATGIIGDAPPTGTGNQLVTPGADVNEPGEIVIRGIQIVLTVAGLVAVLFLIIGGFRYITAGGNEDTVDKAKATIKNAIIGLVIILLAYAILAVVQNFIVTEVGA